MQDEKNTDSFNYLTPRNEQLDPQLENLAEQSPRQYQKQQIGQVLRIEGENRAIALNDGDNDRLFMGYQEISTDDDT